MKRNLPVETNILLYSLLLILACSTSIIAVAQTPDFGKSYINVTKGLNGGTVETGDTLEIRASFVVRSGTFDSCSYSERSTNNLPMPSTTTRDGSMVQLSASTWDILQPIRPPQQGEAA
jgi:hypothetical protein